MLEEPEAHHGVAAVREAVGAEVEQLALLRRRVRCRTSRRGRPGRSCRRDWRRVGVLDVGLVLNRGGRGLLPRPRRRSPGCPSCPGSGSSRPHRPGPGDRRSSRPLTNEVASALDVPPYTAAQSIAAAEPATAGWQGRLAPTPASVDGVALELEHTFVVHSLRARDHEQRGKRDHHREGRMRKRRRFLLPVSPISLSVIEASSPTSGPGGRLGQSFCDGLACAGDGHIGLSPIATPAVRSSYIRTPHLSHACENVLHRSLHRRLRPLATQAQRGPSPDLSAYCRTVIAVRGSEAQGARAIPLSGIASATVPCRYIGLTATGRRGRVRQEVPMHRRHRITGFAALLFVATASVALAGRPALRAYTVRLA